MAQAGLTAAAAPKSAKCSTLIKASRCDLLGILMQPRNLRRLLRALSRQGLDVDYNHPIYSVRLQNSPNAPVAEVLLPEGFPVEAKAFKQLANLANIRHPSGGHVCQVCATPDFYPGDAGVAIGSVVETEGMIIPAAVGSDINCGMRLHTADISIDDFLNKRDRFVELIKGDYFLGTRDVTMTAKTSRALFEHGIPGWLDGMLDLPTGSFVNSELDQLATECDRVYLGGSLNGSIRWAPEELVSEEGWVRDGGLGTIGGGNHFVEIQMVEAIEDRATAANYGFVNRLVLAELLRLRLRQVYGDIEAPLVYDLPHNITLPQKESAQIHRWITRKGACPAYAEQPVIIPGSMGTPSYLVVGQGNPAFLWSASHGAGRLRSRFELSRRGAGYSEETLGLTGVDCITLWEERRIEEAPVAYKPIQPVIEAQVKAEMVSVVARLRPILTFKA